MTRSAPLAGHLETARRRMPGPDYYEVLRWLHAFLVPRTYVEVGVRRGASLRLAGSTTRSLGIDPAPMIDAPLDGNATLAVAPSDEALRKDRLSHWLAGDPLDLAFIDGLHLCEQVLTDFVHLESVSADHTVIVLHDTMPLDATTSARVRTTDFYSGDVWRAASCLSTCRPDLTLSRVPAFPTGLTLVTGLGADRVRPRGWYDTPLATWRDVEWAEHLAAGRLVANTPATVRRALQPGLDIRDARP